MHPLLVKLRDLFQGPTKPAPRRPTCRLEFETLERRELLANASGIIRGVAFVDFNRNGARDRGETLLPGVRVRLVGTTDQGRDIDVKAVANSQGAFRFLNVLPGQYRLRSKVSGFRQLGTLAVVDIDGGETVRRNVRFRGLVSDSVSVRQFLTNSSGTDFHPPAGSGTALANYRPNNRPTVANAIADVSVFKNAANTLIDLAGHFSDPDFTNSRVRIHTSEGPINVVLFDTQAPRTVANFFNYVVSNRYDNTIFHRLVSNFVLQGGGFRFQANPSSLPAVLTDSTVQNEFSATRSNVRGTVAMAKVDGNPNSATSQFFFNLADNSNNLDNQNGGFTVFGRLAGDADQTVVNRLAAYPIRNQGGNFTQIPLKNYTGNNFPTDTTASNYALIRDVEIIRRDEFLRYEVVANTNPSLVTAAIQRNRLSLDYADNATGTATITVRAIDRYGASVTDTFTVTVNNQAPTATVNLTPDPARTNDTLTATVTRSDPDGDPVTLTYRWLVDGNEMKVTTTTATTDTFDLSIVGNGDKGQTITVEVTPNDGTVNGTTASDALTIINSAPQILTLALSPDPPSATDTLTANVTTNDDDGDTVTLSYLWRLNGFELAGETSDTLDLATVGASSGDQIDVEVTPNDGSENGALRFATVTVA